MNLQNTLLEHYLRTTCDLTLLASIVGALPSCIDPARIGDIGFPVAYVGKAVCVSMAFTDGTTRKLPDMVSVAIWSGGMVVTGNIEKCGPVWRICGHQFITRDAA